MLFCTLFSVYQQTAGLYASVSSINHADYISRLISVCISVTSDVLVVNSLYITFPIHKEQIAFQVHALWIIIRLGFWGT